MTLKDWKDKMTPLTIALLSFLGGSLVTGGTIWGITKSQKQEQDIEAIIKSLESEFEKAQASAVVSLTETDLLKVPCSAEYIQDNGDLLCREMFCRMNRQGDGDSATAKECSDISQASLNKLKLETCIPYWDEETASPNGLNLNSKFGICIEQFKKD
tara:strand:+ start:82 stop:552 length:471 start_codon:yes stop_codon:yes gene_type:complete